ncbi:MAG: TAXI family TRAP transporter solute-binding subunit [Burkholderiaceae bacterium]
MKLHKLLATAAMLLPFAGAHAAEDIKMATIAPGTTTYRTSTTFSKIVNQSQSDYRVTVDASGTAPKQRMDMAQGKLDIGLTSPVMYGFMKTQDGMFKKVENSAELAKNLRLLMWIPYGQNHIVVHADSDIKTLGDLKGKKVFLGPPGGGAWTTSYEWIKGATGLDANKGDYQAVKASWASAIEGFQDNQFDAYIAGALAPAPSIEQLALTRGIRLIGLSKEEFAANQMLNDYINANPGRDVGIIKSTAYGDNKNIQVANDIYTLSVKIGIAARADLPEDAVYKIMKAYWENVDAEAKTSPWLDDITKDYAVAAAGMQLHPGALKYYKEAGVKVPEGSM